MIFWQISGCWQMLKDIQEKVEVEERASTLVMFSIIFLFVGWGVLSHLTFWLLWHLLTCGNRSFCSFSYCTVPQHHLLHSASDLVWVFPKSRVWDRGYLFFESVFWRSRSEGWGSTVQDWKPIQGLSSMAQLQVLGIQWVTFWGTLQHVTQNYYSFQPWKREAFIYQVSSPLCGMDQGEVRSCGIIRLLEKPQDGKQEILRTKLQQGADSKEVKPVQNSTPGLSWNWRSGQGGGRQCSSGVSNTFLFGTDLKYSIVQ